MKTTLMICLIVLLGATTYAQNNQNEIKKDPNGVIKYIKFPPPQNSENSEATVPETAADFFKEYLNITNSDQFIKEPKKQRSERFIHEHYNQFYKGIKVKDGGYNFHFRDGRMYLAHGHYVKIKELDPTPAISVEKAVSLFAEYKEIPKDSVFDHISELLIKEISSTNKEDVTPEPKLVYKIYLYANCAHNDKVGFVDAHTGKVVATEPRVLDYSVIATFETRYNSLRYATTQYYNDEYNLCDSSRVASGGPVIHTWNLDGDVYFNQAVELTNDNTYWEGYSTNEDDMGLDIHWTLQEIVDYLNDEHDLNSYDDLGSIVNAYFHYGYDALNDNDARDMAGYDPNQDEPGIFFGDGYVLYRPLSSLDAVAHEYGHMITDALINWGFTGNHRAFHEGLSDIWAVILENRINSNSIWEIGDLVSLNDDCIRNIADPDDSNAELEIADYYLSTLYNDTSEPSKVPYIRSGVFSHWFYLLVNGNDDHTVYGIGMDAAEDLIAYAVMEEFLDDSNTSYPDIREAFEDAAEALFGSNSLEVMQVANAWYAVGVGSEPTQIYITGPDVVCPSGATYTVNNLPTGNTINWTDGSYITRSSSQESNPCTFISTGVGNSWVKASISSSYSSISIPQIDVTASSTNDLDAVYSECGGGGPVGYSCPFWVAVYNPSDDIVWGVSPSATITDFGNGIANITFNSPGSYTISAYASNDCGAGDPVYTYFYAYQMLMSPNPAYDEVVITIDDGATDNLKSGSLDDEEYTVTITDVNGIAKSQKKYKGKRFTVQVQHLKEGNYFVNLSNDKMDETRQLIIKR